MAHSAMFQAFFSPKVQTSAALQSTLERTAKNKQHRKQYSQ
jgi:hypothetical protein